MDCKVRIITDGEKGDIINQYVRFCYVLNEQIRTFGRTRKAVEETIRICQEENVLKDYLKRQWEEVIDMMLTLFDQETLMRNHDASVERRGRAEGHQEMADLMNYLWSHGRSEDALKASQDEYFRQKLLAELNGIR